VPVLYSYLATASTVASQARGFRLERPAPAAQIPTEAFVTVAPPCQGQATRRMVLIFNLESDIFEVY
jgi:hypothetical protein